MEIGAHFGRALGHLARRLGPLGMGCALACAAMGGGAAHAVPASLPHVSCSDVQCVIQFGDTAIQDRLTSLNTLNGKISAAASAGHITSSDASTLAGDVSTNVSGLNALKTKLDGETDISAARTDVKNIYAQFRIYAVVLPRDYNEIWLDEENVVAGKLQGVQSTVQNALNAAANLKDTDNDGDLAAANAAFSDEQGQVTAATGQTGMAAGMEGNLTPANFDSDPGGYKTTFDTFHGEIHTAHTDLVAAGADLHKVYRELADLIAEQPNSGQAAQPEP